MNFIVSSTFELHGFCDASTFACAAVVYLKTLNPVTQMLVAAKTRITPASAITLPCLELCSALLLSELFHVVQDALLNTVYQTFLWTDCTIALSWILKPIQSQSIQDPSSK